MDGFDLGRLNPFAFERLVRALCFATMGPAGTVYSSGPDGGRDFIYDGAISGYEGKGWNGYLVVQAKFKDPGLSKTDDILWLREQLERELNKFTSGASNSRKPDYYILATNVRLSGADGASNKKKGTQRKGGMTKAEELFAPWAKTLKIKGFDIWPHDKLIDLLVAQPSIRQTYAQWITSGDVLAKALQYFTSIRPDFGEAAVRSIKNSLLRDQFVRLKDAGSVGDLQIRTSQVVVDLPLSTDWERPFGLSSWDEDDVAYFEHEADVPQAIAMLVDRAREKLDPDTLFADDEPDTGHQSSRNKIVLMGGPGQGKSTISLFLAQIFRAGLLKLQSNLRRDPATKRLVAEILQRADGERIPTSFPPRFPCHVSLPKFADVISAARTSSGKLPSLLAYLAMEIGTCADHEVDRSDLRNWLRSYPWLLVLDGLDEVPSSGERPAILDAINFFFTEVTEVNADILVVVTTRPQGYNKDLYEKQWEHWRLADLHPPQALRYAKAFGEARYPDDAPRREEVRRALRKAASQAATARLMVTPLQVTILHFIVDTGGGVPTARWALFNEYFEVLKKREKAKGGELQKILERHWGHLGPIHHRAGLVLQTDSEHSGGAGSSFSPERFRRLIFKYLESEGFVDAELTQRVDELMQLATDRLVLLSQQTEGTISFDVRSLQEFMAAAALTSGDQSIMETRLSHIAGNSHWRHVFQIAASRCFADDSFHYRRATITQIAREMDSLEPDMIVGNGARLALDLLADGVALDQPNFRRPLIKHALEQIDLGSDALDARLSEVCDDSVADIVTDVVYLKIKDGKSDASMAAWKLLFQLSQQGRTWADDLIIQYCPDGPMDADLLDEIDIPLGSQRLADHLAKILAAQGPILGIQAYQFGQRLVQRQRREERIDYSRLRAMNFAPFYYGEAANRIDCAILPGSLPTPYSVKITSIENASAFSQFDSSELRGDAWAFIQSVREFTQTPSKRTLAACLRNSGSIPVAPSLERGLPWPILTLLAEASDPERRKRLAVEVELGLRGDVAHWLAAEKRWHSNGLIESDFFANTEEQWFDDTIAERGLPAWIDSYENIRYGNIAIAKKLTALSKDIKNQKITTLVLTSADVQILFGARRDSWLEKDLDFLLDRLENSNFRFSHGLYQAISAIPSRSWQDSKTAAKIGRLLARLELSELQLQPIRDFVFQSFEKNPQVEELYYAIVATTLAEKNKEGRLKRIANAKNADGRDPHTLAAILTARLAEAENRNQVLEELMAIEKSHFLLLAALASECLSVATRLNLLSMLMMKLKEKGSPKWRDYISVARKTLDSRKSDLTSYAQWTDTLKLPVESYSLLLPQAHLD